MVDSRVPPVERSKYTSSNLEVRTIVNELRDVFDWESVGLELGIRAAKLQEIRDYRMNQGRLCKISMADTWLHSDVNATWKKLADALEKTGNDDVAKRIRHGSNGSTPSAPAKPTPSTTSPLAISSSLVKVSPDVPSTSGSVHSTMPSQYSPLTSATGKRVMADTEIIRDEDIDSGSTPSAPAKLIPSNTSPLEISSSPVEVSPDVPSASESARSTMPSQYSPLISATGKRVMADTVIIQDEDIDSDGFLPPRRKESDPMQGSTPSTPAKSISSSTSPLEISSSLVEVSPDVPPTSESVRSTMPSQYSPLTSATGKRVMADTEIIRDEDIDSDGSLPPRRKESDPMQDIASLAPVSQIRKVSDPVRDIFYLCGIDKLKDEPLQQISENTKKCLPRALLQLDSIIVPNMATPLYGKGVEIAILDSGIYLYHEVFQSKGDGQINGYNFVNTANDPQHSWFSKPELHGTAVAAVAAGKVYSSPSGPCVGGIAPSASLYICRVFSNNGN